MVAGNVTCLLNVLVCACLFFVKALLVVENVNGATAVLEVKIPSMIEIKAFVDDDLVLAVEDIVDFFILLLDALAEEAS